MLENFIICVNAVVPMFLLVLVGVGVRRFNILTPHEVSRVNRLVFKVFFPVLMFNNLYSQDVGSVVKPKLLVYAICAVLVILALSTAVVMKIEPNDKTRGAMIQAMYRSNFVIMGIPIASNIYGDQVGTTAVLTAVVVPMYNVIAVVLLETFRGGNSDLKIILKRIATNPLILGAAAGILSALLGIDYPKALDQVFHQMGSSAAPLGLIVLGASFSFSAIKKEKRDLIIAILTRLIFAPALGLTGAALLGFRGIDFLSLLAMMTAPCAVSSFTMAEAMDSDADLAAATVVFTTLFSVLTMFGWLFLFKNLGFF